jgi:DNA-binding CsgD family transcriptional regulator
MSNNNFESFIQSSAESAMLDRLAPPDIAQQTGGIVLDALKYDLPALDADQQYALIGQERGQRPRHYLFRIPEVLSGLKTTCSDDSFITPADAEHAVVSIDSRAFDGTTIIRALDRGTAMGRSLSLLHLWAYFGASSREKTAIEYAHLNANRASQITNTSLSTVRSHASNLSRKYGVTSIHLLSLAVDLGFARPEERIQAFGTYSNYQQLLLRARSAGYSASEVAATAKVDEQIIIELNKKLDIDIDRNKPEIQAGDEMEVLKMIVAGLENKQIASELSIGKDKLHNIRSALNVKLKTNGDIKELLLTAHAFGLATLPSFAVATENHLRELGAKS